MVLRASCGAGFAFLVSGCSTFPGAAKAVDEASLLCGVIDSYYSVPTDIISVGGRVEDFGFSEEPKKVEWRADVVLGRETVKCGDRNIRIAFRKFRGHWQGIGRVQFDTTFKYASMSTGYQAGDLNGAGYQCLFKALAGNWRFLGCDLLFVS